MKRHSIQSDRESPVAEKVLAAVRTAANTTEIREYPMPDVPADAALLKMEVAGICGTDVRLYQEPPTNKPTIMGHENIGYIAKCGAEFTRRKGFKEGDLVFLEHYVMCGKCEWCHRASIAIARTPIGAPTPTPSATATRPTRRPRTCGAASPSTSTCPGTRCCITCPRACRPNSPASSRRWRTAWSGACSMARSATTRWC